MDQHLYQIYDRAQHAENDQTFSQLRLRGIPASAREHIIARRCQRRKEIGQQQPIKQRVKQHHFLDDAVFIYPEKQPRPRRRDAEEGEQDAGRQIEKHILPFFLRQQSEAPQEKAVQRDTEAEKRHRIPARAEITEQTGYPETVAVIPLQLKNAHARAGNQHQGQRVAELSPIEHKVVVQQDRHEDDGGKQQLPEQIIDDQLCVHSLFPPFLPIVQSACVLIRNELRLKLIVVR